MAKKIAQKNTLSVFPLRGKIMFPDTIINVEVGRSATLQALKNAEEQDNLVFVCAQKNANEEFSIEDLYTTGTVCKIQQIMKPNSVPVRVILEGLYRASCREIVANEGFFYASCEEILPIEEDDVLQEAYFRTAKALVGEIQQAEGRIPKEVFAQLDACGDIDKYINLCASVMHIREDIKQQLLQENNVTERLKLFERCLNDELEVSKLERKIALNVRKSIDKQQKEYYLREQLRAIHAELGDDMQEQDQLKDSILHKNLPKAIEEKALKEIERMSKMQPNSPEYTVGYTYIQWILDLPWSEQTKDTELLSDSVLILEHDHYGLEKIKQRITEYLAVLKLTGEMKAPILCFVGPPGVGKTSIAKSIARALNRKFVRMSLGGVKDEAEIRGHRRTYIGAMPGRILYAMKEAKSSNPVFLLDEIDKVSSDMRGDPASALLEVLDPEQNSTFRDRYLEEEYDLSKVLFIATANSLDTIPAPLLDRMEVITLSGYTMDEKKEIAKRYLCPKKIAENGLTDNLIAFTEDGLQTIIENYTMEAGVRSLEREIGSVCRKVAVVYADHRDMEKVTVDKEAVEKYLGVKKYQREDFMAKKDEIGAATGLAWTAVGGTTLTIEVAVMDGKGEVKLTGKLGDVMKESAQAAITYIRSHAECYGLKEDIFEKTDIHIHVPEGATPKDGPSAGITMATAILSAFTGKPVRRDVAMTGEITLRGKVLPIGGLKEKALAAYRIGIKNIIIPEDNKKDLEDIPQNIRGSLNFIPVENVGVVFSNAIVGG